MQVCEHTCMPCTHPHHTCTHTSVHAYTRAYKHAYARMYIRTHVHACVHNYVRPLHKYIRSYAHTSTSACMHFRTGISERQHIQEHNPDRGTVKIFSQVYASRCAASEHECFARPADYDADNVVQDPSGPQQDLDDADTQTKHPRHLWCMHVWTYGLMHPCNGHVRVRVYTRMHVCP